MTNQATAEQIREGVIAAITSEPVANERWREMSHDELRAQGYVIGFGNQTEGEYRGDPCQHLSLSQSLAKEFVRECPDDAWRQHPKGGNERKKPSKAMEDSSFVDTALTDDDSDVDEGLKSLLATDVNVIAEDQPKVWRRVRSKATKNKSEEIEEIPYNDWQKFRVIDAPDFRNATAKECRDDARKHGLTPMLLKHFVKAAEEAKTMRVRLELAGIDMRKGKRQVPIFWVEFADDGTPVQCRGLLDQLEETNDRYAYTIRDLKAVKSLNRKTFARTVYECGWHIQHAAYTSGVEKITGEYGRVNFEWAAVRKGDLPAAARRDADGMLKECGRIEWRIAVNGWARCIKAGIFPGYELAGVEHVYAEPWMMARTEELLAAANLENGE